MSYNYIFYVIFFKYMNFYKFTSQVYDLILLRFHKFIQNLIIDNLGPTSRTNAKLVLAAYPSSSLRHTHHGLQTEPPYQPPTFESAAAWNSRTLSAYQAFSWPIWMPPRDAAIAWPCLPCHATTNSPCYQRRCLVAQSPDSHLLHDCVCVSA